MVSWKHSGPSVQESLASQSVRAIATRGDRARRVSAALGRIARYAPAVAAAACLTSVLSPSWAAPPLWVRSCSRAGLAVAGGDRPAARYCPRALDDDAVAQLDRAAGLEGSLRSAHWFAGHSRPRRRCRITRAAWIASHVHDAASAGARRGLDRASTSARRGGCRGRSRCAASLLTAGLSVRPLPRLGPGRTHGTAPAAAQKPLPRAHQSTGRAGPAGRSRA